MKINAFKIRILAAERGWNVMKLAKESGVSRQTVSYILSGKRCSPQVAYKLATALEVRLEHIAEEE